MTRLVAGPLRLPRRFRSHLGALGNAYRRHFLALEREYGPFTSELAREAAADAAECFVRKLVAGRSWQEALTKRQTGTGRRPAERDVIRLSKRAALDDSSYLQACNRLRDLIGSKRPPALADAVAAAHQQTRTVPA